MSLRRMTSARASGSRRQPSSDQHCREGEFAWAPDSKSLAFFSDCANSADHQVDLYLSRLDGTPAKRLTNLKGLPQAPAFSPDGSKIAFLYVEGATRPAGALAAMKPPSGVIGEDGVEDSARGRGARGRVTRPRPPK